MWSKPRASSELPLNYISPAINDSRSPGEYRFFPPLFLPSAYHVHIILPLNTTNISEKLWEHRSVWTALRCNSKCWEFGSSQQVLMFFHATRVVKRSRDSFLAVRPAVVFQKFRTLFSETCFPALWRHLFVWCDSGNMLLLAWLKRVGSSDRKGQPNDGRRHR